MITDMQDVNIGSGYKSLILPRITSTKKIHKLRERWKIDVTGVGIVYHIFVSIIIVSIKIQVYQNFIQL